jgi:hypothetical protein
MPQEGRRRSAPRELSYRSHNETRGSGSPERSGWRCISNPQHTRSRVRESQHKTAEPSHGMTLHACAATRQGVASTLSRGPRLLRGFSVVYAHGLLTQEQTIMAKPKGKCVFCGSGEGLTKSHVWPEWAEAILPVTATHHEQIIGEFSTFIPKAKGPVFWRKTSRVTSGHVSRATLVSDATAAGCGRSRKRQ